MNIADKRSKKRLADLKKILKATDLIIIDEISMISTTLLDMIAYRLESLGHKGRLLFLHYQQVGEVCQWRERYIRAIEDNYLIVEKNDIFIRVERHEFDLLDMVVKPNGSVETIVLATLSQFPIKLAYAVTIHKSQGMSIDKLICNADNIFAPSQFYVAISRAIDPKRLKIELNRGDLKHYLQRVIRIDQRVVEYYKSNIGSNSKPNLL